MSHRILRLVSHHLPCCLRLAFVRVAQNDGSQQAATTKQPHALDWESANAKRMFVLVNDGSAISAISVDTTQIEDLHAAMKLQELVFRISGTRMPIVDKQFVTVPCGKIHIAWDHYPMVVRPHSFEISMKETDSTSYNPPKQVIIAGSAGDIDNAVTAFTEAALGIPLKALDDDKYKWEQVRTVAIPEKMKTIFGKFKAE